jgi:hypothetical protein
MRRPTAAMKQSGYGGEKDKSKSQDADCGRKGGRSAGKREGGFLLQAPILMHKASSLMLQPRLGGVLRNKRARAGQEGEKQEGARPIPELIQMFYYERLKSLRLHRGDLPAPHPRDAHPSRRASRKRLKAANPQVQQHAPVKETANREIRSGQQPEGQLSG